MKDNHATPYIPPSTLRWPITLLLACFFPPFGLFAWILLSGSDRRVYFRSPWIRGGIALICLGVLPLLIMVLLSWLGLLQDPNPNPIGFGLLFVTMGFIGCLTILIGIIRHSRQRSI